MFKKTDILFYKDVSLLTFVITISLSCIIIIVKLTSYVGLLLASANVFATLSIIFIFLFSQILTTILPISVFTASALVATRMVADREMDALFSSGMSLKQLLLPPFILGFLTMIIMFGNAFYYSPYIKREYRFFKMFQARQIVETFIGNNLNEKSFISDFPLLDKEKFIFYTESILKSNDLSEVFITIENGINHKNMFLAKKGSFTKDTSTDYQDFVFTLSNGTFYSDRNIVTYFDKINFFVVNAFENKLKPFDNAEDTIEEKTYLDKIKIISSSLCTFFFPALGTCLGLLGTHTKTFRVYFGIGFISIVFYSLLTLCGLMVTKLHVYPSVAYSIPPIVFFIFTILLVRERYKIK